MLRAASLQGCRGEVDAVDGKPQRGEMDAQLARAAADFQRTAATFGHASVRSEQVR
ncbi:hypothetical protein [Streptomyces huasconensis]|uniref:hypothetical protein n=1 Tax=Streptomyces huasconensis TaxID=1854574 RepID=UPI0033C8596B